MEPTTTGETSRLSGEAAHDPPPAPEELLRAAIVRIGEAVIGDAIIATDADGRVFFLNSAARNLTGWTQEEAQRLPLESVFHAVEEQTREPIDNLVSQALKQDHPAGSILRAILFSKDGAERPIELNAAPITRADGSPVGAVLVFRDITDWRRVEREAQQSEARKTAILDTALDCIITMDHEGRVVEFNPAAEKTFGYQRSELVGQELARYIIPPGLRDRHRRGLHRYLASGEGRVLNRRIELTGLHADGTEFPLELTITRIPSDGPPLFTAYLRDISERTRAEALRNARFAITQILAKAATTREAAAGLLRVVCENLGWDIGCFWTPDDQTAALRCLESWRRPGVSAAFEAASRDRSFARGEGLPGRVWNSGQPAWISSVTEDPNFLRASSAAAEGLHGAFACPVVAGGETHGVIEFFSQRVGPPNADLLEIMNTIAGQLGQFVERRGAEEALRESEEKFRLMADTIPQLAWMARPDGHIFWYNRRWYEYTGTTPEQMEGWGWQSVHDPSMLPQVMDQWRRSLESGASFDMVFPLRGSDGRFRPFLTRINPLRDETGRILYWFGTNTDISNQKRTEDISRFLADASATLAAVVDYESTLGKVARLAVPFFADWCSVDMPEPDGSLRRLAVVHVDPSKVELANELFRRYPPRPDDPYGSPRVLESGVPEMASEISDAILEASAQDEDQLRLLRELGLRSYISVPLITRGKPFGVLNFLTSESGRQYGPADLALAEDLAHRAAVAIDNARLYAELRHADRLKDEYLAMLAHELRNPLAPIRNALHIMKQPGANAAMLQRVRDVADRQVQHMATLLDDLLDVSRVSQGRIELRKEPVEIAALITRTIEAVRSLVEDRRHELTISLPAGPLQVEADPTRLEQVLTNLLTNAAKYTDPGGHIWVTAGREGDEVIIRVRDNGVGIDPELISSIFDLFVQAERRLDRSRGGIGIGLTLVKRLVELHGGSAAAHSAGPGQGSEFVIRLPSASNQLDQTKGEPAPGEESPLPRRRVLVVDDNQDAADSLALLLRLVGQDVQTAYDGPSALARAQEFRPELVFLDIGMPGMDGYEVARRLRQQQLLESVLLVALTGWGQESDRRRSHEAGFNHHLVKPVQLPTLQSLLGMAPSAIPESYTGVNRLTGG